MVVVMEEGPGYDKTALPKGLKGGGGGGGAEGKLSSSKVSQGPESIKHWIAAICRAMAKKELGSQSSL